MKKLYFGLAIAFIIVLIFGGIVGAQDEEDDPSPAPVEEIILIPPPPEVAIGDDYIICVEILPDNATNKIVIWSSSNPDIATVEAIDELCALVTPLKTGTAIITATTEDGGFTETFTINPDYPETTPPTGGMQASLLAVGALFILAVAAVVRRYKANANLL